MIKQDIREIDPITAVPLPFKINIGESRLKLLVFFVKMDFIVTNNKPEPFS